MPAEGIDDGMPFLRYKHKEEAWYLRGMRLPLQPRYLHQLQNIVYALLGEDLPVSLGALKTAIALVPLRKMV
jgi:hypothetical protein